jgi:hypothetical protein
MPVPLDEYPLHQVPLSMAYVATSDRNAYDRCYVNAHDRTGDLFVVSGCSGWRGARSPSARPSCPSTPTT